MTTLVLGIGNTLLGDEGAGVHVVRALAERYADRDDLVFLDGGTLSFTLVAPIGAAPRLIVVDAAELLAAPGRPLPVVNRKPPRGSRRRVIARVTSRRGPTRA